MQKALEVVGKISRYILAAVACVSFAQFLLLIGVSTERAQRLAWETLGRAILCGSVAAWWFHRDRRMNRLKLAAEKLMQVQHSSQREGQVTARYYCNSCGAQVSASVVLCPSCGKPTPPPPPIAADFGELPQFPQAQTSLRSIAEPPKTGTDSSQKDRERKSLLLEWLIFGSVVLVLVVAIIESGDVGKQGNTFDTLANKNKSVSPDVTSNPADSIWSGGQPPTPVSPCATGIPPGVQVLVINVIDAALGIAGSEGKAWYDTTDHRVDYTVDQYAAHGYSETGYYVGQWYFSFKVTNNTAIDRPDLKFGGYCITALQYEVEIQSDDGKRWKGSGKQNLLEGDYHPLGPGWRQELTRQKLSLSSRPKNGNLVDWRITKAWGFPLNPEDRAKMQNRIEGQAVSESPVR